MLKETIPQFLNELTLSSLLLQFFFKKELEEEGVDFYDTPLENADDEDIKKYEKEFLFDIFKFLVIGGKFNQYDNDVNIYREMAKKIYKESVDIRKDDSNQIYLASIFIEIYMLDVL